MTAGNVTLSRRAMLTCVAAGTVLATAEAAEFLGAPLRDLIDTPTLPSAFARKGRVSGITRHESALVAVGPRGLILVSRDAGASWTQVTTPVASDLVAVKFIDANTLWAVGHDAVALQSKDAGATWVKVLDGRSVYAMVHSYYEELSRAGAASATLMLE